MYPDLRKRQLVDAESKIFKPGFISKSNIQKLAHLNKTDSQDIQNLINKYSTITKQTSFNLPIKHNVQHHIKTTGPPATYRFRRLTPEKLKEVKAEFQHILDLKND